MPGRTRGTIRKISCEGLAHLKMMFNSDHSLFREYATVVVQIEPLPACLVHLVSLTTSLRRLH